MIVARTFEETRRAAVGRIGLVPTMGYLHEGHLANVAAVRDTADIVVMSLFVNPLQFDDPEDLERYPRDEERDFALAAQGGVDIVFAPDAAHMYPNDPLTRVSVSVIGEALEADHRPGHFDGVATVVAKLLAGLQPHAATFGRKDAQQLAVVRRLVADLSFPVSIVEVSTVREPDGLALSSRNVRIRDRGAARGLSAGLFAAADRVTAGERSAVVLEGAVREEATSAGAEVEYAVLADAATAAPIPSLDRRAFLAVAARVDGIRLIDNVFFESDGAADRGVYLESPSILGGT